MVHLESFPINNSNLPKMSVETLLLQGVDIVMHRKQTDFLLVDKYNYVTISHDDVGFLSVKSERKSFKNWHPLSSRTQSCSNNSAKLQTLLNIVCSTAQPTNATTRDACYGCFTRFSTLPQGQQQTTAISMCASRYFAGTSYAPCATRLAAVLGSSQVYTPTNGQCAPGYCEFVRCLRRTNSENLIIQCAREVRMSGPTINVTADASNIRYYTNITSCILAKSRCNTFNPITGEPQLPGIVNSNTKKSQTQVSTYNTLQITPEGALRTIAFPSTLTVASSFCSSDPGTLSQTNWMDNQCP